MRVAVIAPPWLAVPPIGYGGTEAVLDNLCRGLRLAGHDVLLYTTGDSTCPVERAWTYEVALGTEQAAPVAELRHVIDGYAAVEAWGADIVHDNTISGLVLSSEHPDLPVVTTNHGPFESELAPIYRHVAERVPIVAISHHQASLAGDIPVAAVIHHGIDMSRYPLGTGSGGYALFLGRMSPNKGVHTAIEIARRAGVRLRIAAKMREQPERAYFAARVQPLLGPDVEYLGEVGGQDKHQLLSDASCLLNPICWPEPFGMVMIEALAHGTPVVATPSGAVPEVVDDGVTGFVRKDPEHLADALLRVGDLDRSACRAAVARHFSMERMAAEHLALYEKHIDARSSSGTTGAAR